MGHDFFDIQYNRFLVRICGYNSDFERKFVQLKLSICRRSVMKMSSSALWLPDYLTLLSHWLISSESVDSMDYT